MKNLTCLILCLLNLNVLGQVSDEGGVIKTVEYSSVRELLQAELERQGWVEGPNIKDKKMIFVSTGIGVVNKSLFERGFHHSRSMAFDKAYLRAKQFMVEYLGQQIATESVLKYSENERAYGLIGNAPKKLLDKIYFLADSKLNQLIEAEKSRDGHDISNENLADMAMSSEEYRRMTLQLANALLVGCQPFKVFEIQDPSGKSQIGVIMVYSPKLVDFAYAITTDASVFPKANANMPLLEQLPNKSDEMLRNFGVSLRIDENGNYVILSFGQASATTRSDQSNLMAQRKARIKALGNIRSFAGESVDVMSLLIESESVYEFQNSSKTDLNQGGYVETIKTKSKGLQVSGVEQVKSWVYNDDVTGDSVHGVVLAWSPGKNDKAKRFKSEMTNPIKYESEVKKQPDGKSRAFEGIEGDLNVF